jgi:hypothetical protein
MWTVFWTLLAIAAASILTLSLWLFLGDLRKKNEPVYPWVEVVLLLSWSAASLSFILYSWWILL